VTVLVAGDAIVNVAASAVVSDGVAVLEADFAVPVPVVGDGNGFAAGLLKRGVKNVTIS